MQVITMPIIKCGKWKFKKFIGKLSTGDDSLSKEGKRYTVHHSIQDNVVRVYIHDNKLGGCVVRNAKHSTGAIIHGNKLIEDMASQQQIGIVPELYIDVDEPTTEEIKAGVTLEQKIAEAYDEMQIKANDMNYMDQKPYRLAEAVRKFEESRNTESIKNNAIQNV
jgi:hypothetical protein